MGVCVCVCMSTNFDGRKYFLVADTFCNDIKLHRISVLSRTNFDKIYSRNLCILSKISTYWYSMLYYTRIYTLSILNIFC